ncbi:chaperone DnaJ-domain superfamily protein [Klebsormidium nitens]|uniref:Chaperone DnaJ-domain superfamily protein n=1 Tax=Klebsormidium nitens TaxID=105231 RepID=A0A1Y1IJL7_KLENI|nr:chaperone DnaJ-domain superfamily protein [Klebsormidium nitens]|eukprot:GAQ88926.1 chaperone DnaJ-domain superfamily protein [Klebsormidium nitens]
MFAYGSALRGGKSLANLGTVAILLLPWAAVVSSGAVLVTKLGWTTLIFLAALAFGLFRYYGTMAGILAVGVYSVVALFLGGSPWTTLLVTVAGCALFYFRYTALALVGTLCYAALSVYRTGGYLAVGCTFLAACLSNDVIQYLAAQLPPEEKTPGAAASDENVNAGRSREWSWTDPARGAGWSSGTSQSSQHSSWKDTTGGSGWSSGNSQQRTSRENFYNSTYGGGRGDGTSGRGRGRDSGRGAGESASTSGSSYSYGGSGRPGREREASEAHENNKKESPKSSQRNGSSAWWQNGGPSDRGGHSEQEKEKASPGAVPPFARSPSFAADLGDAEAEVARIIACTTHWAVMDIARGATIDIAEAKRTYHKKARLVHPDKNAGCANAGEAFKCLQAAYETLIDPVKRKDYEDELKAKDMGERFHKMAEEARNHSQGGRGQSGASPFANFDPEEFFRESDSKKVHCYHCGDSHEWLKVDRPKKACRWCTECNKYHGAAEGDGWFEQASRPTFFGLFKQEDPMQAFCVEGGQVYLCTTWVECQGMAGRPNTHKPSFEVKSEGRGRGGGGGGGRSGGRGKGRGRGEPDLSDVFESEDDFWHFMEDLMRQGGGPPGSFGPKSQGSGKGGAGKPKPSKKQRQKAKRNGW